MLDMDMLKALADEISIVAVMMRGGEFAVCVSSGDATGEDVKKFTEFLAESVDRSRTALRCQTNGEKDE